MGERQAYTSFHSIPTLPLVTLKRTQYTTRSPTQTNTLPLSQP
jgi:hypothetical protein